MSFSLNPMPHLLYSSLYVPPSSIHPSLSIHPLSLLPTFYIHVWGGGLLGALTTSIDGVLGWTIRCQLSLRLPLYRPNWDLRHDRVKEG